MMKHTTLQVRVATFATGLAAVLAVSISAFAQSPPPAEVYASTPTMLYPRLSPDGQKLAWVDNRDGMQRVMIGSLGSGGFAVERQVAAQGLKARGLLWAGDTHVILTTSETRNISGGMNFTVTAAGRRAEFANAYAINVETANVARLLENDKSLWWNYDLATISSPHYEKPGHVLMPAWRGTTSSTGSRLADGEVSYDLLEVNLDTGKRTGVPENGRPDTVGYLADANGAFARIDYDDDDQSNRFAIYAKDGRTWNTVFEDRVDLPEVYAAGYSGSRSRLVLSMKRDGRDFLAVAEGDGRFSDFYSQPSLDVEGAVVDPYSGEVVGARYTDESPRVVYFDSQLKDLQSMISGQFPDARIGLVSWSRDRNRLIFNVDSPKNSVEYYLLDQAAGSATPLGKERPDLRPDQIADVLAVTYTARDGLTIPAYVTIPPGREWSNLPLVVLPHGGPEARDGGGFDWLAQFVASRGYVVLQPNFRGSSGYGDAFAHAGYGEWGKAMQDDLTDGILYLAGEGLIDTNRVCIFGWSYGGYAALAGATLTPETYRCAIAGAPVSDLPNMLEWERQRYGAEAAASAYWTRNILDWGRLSPNDVTNVSPARLADQALAPILVIHGTNDTVVPYNQSEYMVDALEDAGKSVKLVTLDYADHWLSGGTPDEVKLTVLKEVEAFLAQNLN